MGQKTRLIKGVNDLQTMRPDIAQYWHPTKNDIKPDEIYYNSAKKVWFLYPYDDPNTGKHYDFEWEQQLNYRVKSKEVCPYLAKTIRQEFVYPGFNDLYTRHKELIDSEWDWNKNTVSPSKISENSAYKAWWKCKDFGHEYQRSVAERASHKFCPICCRSLKVSFPEKAVFYYLKQAFPDLIANYKCPFNSRMEIDMFSPSLMTGVEFDGYYAHLSRKTNDNKKNNLCKAEGINLIRIQENYNQKKLPQLNNNAITYQCESRNYKQLENIIKDIIKRLGGPEIDIDIARDTQEIMLLCSGMLIENSLGNLYPELAKEWSPKNKLSPYQIQAQSNVLFWWQCFLCGHEWQNTPNRRISDHKGCPVCSHQKIIEGVNDVFTECPDLKKYWDPDNDIDPYSLTYRSSKKVKLKCPYCGNKEEIVMQRMSERKYYCLKCKQEENRYRIPHTRNCERPAKKKLLAINITTGEEIVFNSGTEAANTLEVDHSGIFKVLRGKLKSLNGYTFKEIEDTTIIKAKKDETQEELIFNSALEAANYFKVDLSNIYGAINGHQKTCKGYILTKEIRTP